MAAPPNEPRNPLPPESGSRNSIWIHPTTWQTLLGSFLDDHKGFKGIQYVATGQPANGTYHTIWSSIIMERDRICTLDNPGAVRTRQCIWDAIKHAGPIGNAVFLGLGRVRDADDAGTDEDKRECFILQAAMFLAICRMIEFNQKMGVDTLPKVFQDPAFEAEEKYILSTVGGSAKHG